MKLHEVIKQACEDKRIALREMALKVSEVEQLTGLLPKVTKKGISIYVDMASETIDIKMPYDIPRVKKFLKQMHALGWKSSNFERSRTVYHLYHDDTEGSVWLFLKFDMDGATCERKKIGTKIVEREEDIYEIVCKDGAEEKAFEVSN